MHLRPILIGFYCLMGNIVKSHGQDITGLWKGNLYNDSTHKYLRYEIAISENKGRLTGYSHTFFIIDDKEYYGVKKLKIRREDSKVILQDEKVVTNNYPVAPPKGVRQVDVLTLEMQDSIMILTGPFTTNPTKEYRSLTGSIRVQRKNDYRQSALIPHLEELGLAHELSFITADASAPIVTIANVNRINSSVERSFAKMKKPVKEQARVKEPEPVKTTPVAVVPAADVANRQIETIQSVYYKSDSLVLTLYDNGEVDGDTVSVLMNGKVIMPMEGLSTKAIRKTIYITKDTPDSIQLIMYAENLGSIPPNTGLLVVHDGVDVYEIRFSGDYQKNAAIVFRKKKG